MAPPVEIAVNELRAAFAGHRVETQADGQGGAFVVIDGLPLGDLYVQDESWMGFHITYLYPAADVYPHYVRPDLTRRDGQPLGPGFSATTWPHVGPAMQLSRRSNRRDVAYDSATFKAHRVLDWIRAPK